MTDDGRADLRPQFGRRWALPLGPNTSGHWNAAHRAERVAPPDHARFDWAPDLGTAIGTPAWWRGLATCLALCWATWLLSPHPFAPVVGDVPPALSGAAAEEAHALAIAPLAFGSTTGQPMAPNDLVLAIAQAPERPIQQVDATLGEGDTLQRLLGRAGVSAADTAAAARLVAGAVPLDQLAPGTRIDLTLGARPDQRLPRPVERLAFRARFDLALAITREDGQLHLSRQPISVDRSPLRLRGPAGPSLHRSLRAAGAPAAVVADYLRALASRDALGPDATANASYDLVIDRARAGTGDVKLGKLLFAGLDSPDHKLELVRWTQNGQEDWYETTGEVRRTGAIGMPVAGHITSGFGMRFHPLLGFSRMHKGIDIGAPVGTPVYAVVDGTVLSAGWSGGYGNFIRLAHGPGLATGYGHLSRIAVVAGQHVQRGQIIGYVGSTGLSTGPHLHWEVWRNGVAVDPQTLSMDSYGTLPPAQMPGFQARVRALEAIRADNG